MWKGGIDLFWARFNLQKVSPFQNFCLKRQLFQYQMRSLKKAIQLFIILYEMGKTK